MRWATRSSRPKALRGASCDPNVIIGNGSSKLMPAVSTLYVDDAPITTSFARP
jgi:hypothetical protein